MTQLQRLVLGRVPLLAWIFVSGLTAVAAASPVCPSTIAICPCTITTSGFYTLESGTLATTGNGDCIKIRAQNVNLNLLGNAIQGPGNSSTGAGIHILSEATNAIIIGGSSTTIGSTISSFRVGIQDDANRATIDFFNTTGNTAAGVLLNKVTGSAVADFTTNDPSVGVDIESSQNCLLNDFSTDNAVVTAGIVINNSQNLDVTNFSSGPNSLNQNVGLQMTNSNFNTLTDWDVSLNNGPGMILDHSNHNFIGGSAIGSLASDNNGYGIGLQFSNGNRIANIVAEETGEGVFLGASSNNIVSVFNSVNNFRCIHIGVGGAVKSGSSNGNRIFDGTVGNSLSGVVSGSKFGVVIDAGSTGNSVSFVNGSGDIDFDAQDNNPQPCKNIWFDNTFGVVDPPACFH